jgi:putative serine/threonine protein kinase
VFSHGHRGMIYTGKWIGKKIAIKKQRDDSPAQNTVTHEANILKHLNKHQIGPHLLFSGDNYFAYQFIEGKFFADYFKTSTKNQVLSLIRAIFQQMYLLDRLGYNKEEMHHPYKHIIITKQHKPVLIDFERCRKTIKPKNVTQFVQCITSGNMRVLLKKKNILIKKQQCLNRAKLYKNDPSKKTFTEILQCLN